MRKILCLILCMSVVFADAMLPTVMSSENIPEYLKPIKESEYIESLLKFSNKLASKNIPVALAEYEVNPDNVLVMTAESIIRGVFDSDKERLSYFIELLNSKDKLKNAFREFVYSTPVSEDGVMEKVSSERVDSYRDYVYKTITDGFSVKTYRGRIASFLAALEYRKKINPGFKIRIDIFDKIEVFYGNGNDGLWLRLEYKDGRHYSDLDKETISQLTIPFDVSVNFDDTYVCMHEIGHAVHYLLGIESKRIPLSVSSKNVWMRNTFFSFIDIVEEMMPIFINQLKSSLAKSLSNGECMWNYFYEELQNAKQFYKNEMQPYDEDEFRRMGIIEVENMLLNEKVAEILKKSDNADDVNQELLREGLRLFAKRRSFSEVWTNAEEMFQIIGIASIGNYIVVDRNADIGAYYDQKKPIRWGHGLFEGTLRKEYKSMLMPEKKYIESLFFLHGLDFEEYKRKITWN